MSWNDELREQYLDATTKVAFVELHGWTTVRLTGRDRASFLHNMCTNDIRNLAPGGQCEAFLTDVKGKIVGHVIVLAEADRLTLITVPDQGAKLIAHLGRYIIREDVQLIDDSPSMNWEIYLGGNRSAVIAEGGAPFHAIGPDITDASDMFLWIGGSWIGTHDCLMDVYPAFPCSDAVWHALRIESGWPLFGVDFDGSNLPQEVGRDAQAISFRKGCYLGQETVARIDALGHVNKRLCTVRLAGEAAAGDDLLADVPDRPVVGQVTSASYSPRLDAWLALAMVRRGHNEPGAKLVCRDMSAEVVPTPAVVA